MSNTVVINKNIHNKLKQISAKRKDEGHAISAMSAILNDLIAKLHKKECE